MTDLQRMADQYCAQFGNTARDHVASTSIRDFIQEASRLGCYFRVPLTERAKREHSDDAMARVEMTLENLCQFVETQARIIQAMSQALTDLQTADTNAASTMDTATQAMSAATALLSGLADRITSAGTDSAQLAVITTDLQTHATTLGNATSAFESLVSSMSSGVTVSSTDGTTVSNGGAATTTLSGASVTQTTTSGLAGATVTSGDIPTSGTEDDGTSDLPAPAAAI
jgi:hypothetical protein